MRIFRCALAVVASAAVGVSVTGTAEAATPAVRLYKIVYDPSGADTHSNAQLNRETVVLKNTGRRTVTLTGWTLADGQKHVYHFPKFMLASGKLVTVHTGKGGNTSTNLYWNSGWYIWNNTGDTATLRTSSGAKVDTCSWSRNRGSIMC